MRRNRSEDNERVRSARHVAARVRRAAERVDRLRRAGALLACGAAFAQATNTHRRGRRSPQGTSGNTIVKFTLKAPPANPPAGFAIASPPRIALDFLDTTNGLGANQRTSRRPGAAQPQPGPGRQPHARGPEPQQAADLRRPRVEGNAVLVTLYDQSEQLDAKAADGAALRRGAARRRRARAARHRLPARQERRGPDHRRPVRQLDRHRHPPAGQAADRRLPATPTLPRNLERRLDVQRLRHAGDARSTPFNAGRQRADGHRAQGPVGALRLPDRQPVHPRGQAGPGGSRTS